MQDHRVLGRDGQDRLARRVRRELGLVGVGAREPRQRARRGRVARERIERLLVDQQRGRAVGEQCRAARAR